MKSRLTLVVALGVIALLIIISGCYRETVIVGDHPVYVPAPSDPGPPPWAPAHGRRAKYCYHYYPASYLYLDTGRAIYFYYSGGDWRASVSLPVGISINRGEYVVLEMETDRPYQYHSDVVRHYPPGQAKKAYKGKDKGK